MKRERYPVRYKVMENFHIVLWLFKDMCWCMGWKLIGLMMIVPTFGFAVYITWLGRTNRSESFHNVAVVFWIIANSIWMTGDFSNLANLRNVALLFFVCGIMVVGYYYLQTITRKLNHINKDNK